jgi:hypothetical protein
LLGFHPLNMQKGERQFMRRRFVDFGATLRLGAGGDLELAMDKAARLRRTASRLLTCCAAVELALEGYVFDIRRSRTQAKWMLRRVRVNDILKAVIERGQGSVVGRGRR